MCAVQQISTLMIILKLSTVKYLSRKHSKVNLDEDDDVKSNGVTGES